MAPALEPSRARGAARGRQILAALLAGATVDEIALAERISRPRVEQALSEELRRRWAPRAQDYARLQIARLDGISAKLAKEAEWGDPRAVAALLRVADRLDRYHGFSKFVPAASHENAGARERLMAKLGRAAARARAPVEPTS